MQNVACPSLVVAEISLQAERGICRQSSLKFQPDPEAETDKKKRLYVLGLIQSLKFFRGRRALSSVLSRNAVLAESVRSRYGNEFTVVNEYYEAKKELVCIVDLAPVLPALVGEDR